ncbi:hypothetical protein [Pseudoclavibacter sp. 8L]|nr:hypothetical protein [Pseudoclavibacter sp. 8L]
MTLRADCLSSFAAPRLLPAVDSILRPGPHPLDPVPVCLDGDAVRLTEL